MTAPTTRQQQAEQQQDPRAQELAWLAALLVLQHQDEQIRIAGLVVARMLPLWGLLDFRDLRTSELRWIEAVLPIVEDGYRQSQLAAQQFVIDYRHANLPAAPELEEITGHRPDSAEAARDVIAEISTLADGLAAQFDQALNDRPDRDSAPGAPAGPTAPDGPAMLLERGQDSPRAKVLAETEFDAQRSAVSLLGTGPGEVRRRMPAPEREAMEAGRLLSAKVAVRLTTDGGRAVVQRAVELDTEAIGWARVLNVNPCSFCAMLASRGAVHKRDSFDRANRRFHGIGIAKVHDGCRCGMRPVYSDSDFRDPTAEDALAQWYRHTKGKTGKDAIKAFRRKYTAPEPPAVPRVDLHSLIVTRNSLLDEGLRETSDQVRWVDGQIARFGALIDTAYDPDVAQKLAARAVADRERRTRNPAETVRTESAADIANRHLPGLRRTLEQLRARGLSEDSPQVQWHRKQIARLTAQV